MTYDFSKSIEQDSNLDFDVVKNLQQIDKEKNSKAKKPKKSDKTYAKYVCEKCQKEGCRLYCIGICKKSLLKNICKLKF